MRGRRPSSGGDSSQFGSGVVAGAISVIVLQVAGSAAFAAYQWATTRAIIPDIAAALTEPAISVVDLFVIVFVLLLFYIIIAMLAMFRGRPA